MNKLGFVILSLAFVLGFGSCKKEAVEVNEPLVFSISANIDDDSKAIVTPLGKIEFNNGDHLYPAYKGLNNRSSLIYKSGNYFSGTITLNNYSDEDKDAVPFHFFCLAGVNSGNAGTQAYWTEEQLKTNCTSTSVCISLQNQGKDSNGWNNKTRDMPLICFGESKENFNGASTTKFTVDLKNKCALVKYVVEADIDYGTEIFVKGLNNVVEVDFKVPYYKYMSDKFGKMKEELKSSRDKGYDEDGFKFVSREGTIQKYNITVNGVLKENVLLTPGSSNIMTDIIIPYRNKPENEGDNTFCYSLLLPQTSGLDKLSGYYYDMNDQKVDLAVKITDKDGNSVVKIEENKFYKIEVNKAPQGN